MKTLRSSLLALVSVFVLASCSKKVDDENVPDLATGITGSYRFMSYVMDGQAYLLPDNFSANASLERQSNTRVVLRYEMKQGNNSKKSSMNNVMLTDIGDGDVKMTRDGKDLGQVETGTLFLYLPLTVNGKEQSVLVFGDK